MVHILYLVHDIHDAAVQKRKRMMEDGGAQVTLGGFRRGAPDRNVLLDFGKTENARLVKRIFSILKACIRIFSYRTSFENTDLILVRNLEMLVIARWALICFKLKKPLIYEVLDIHRLMIQKNIISCTLRTLEKWAGKYASAVITSSPGFLENYFEKYNHLSCDRLLTENKIYPALSKTPTLPPTQKPWRIGWHGMLRCKKSLDILIDLSKFLDGEVEVILSGKPAYDQIPDFDSLVSQSNHMSYTGPYGSLETLADIYEDIHFCWTIDFYEEGYNSDWLLPNRLYEVGALQLVHLARAGTQTASFLQNLGLGVSFESPEKDIYDFFKTLTPESYKELTNKYNTVPQTCWQFSHKDCIKLVDQLKTYTDL